MSGALLLALLASTTAGEHFTLASARGSLRFELAAQLRAELRELDDQPFEEDGTVRRLRTSLEAELFERALRARLHLSPVPGNPELVDLFVDLRLTSGLTLRAGQAKIPFTLYREQPFTELGTTDWSVVTRHFGSERQRGFTLLMKHGALRGALGAFQGDNARATHAVGLARDVYKRELLNPSSLLEGNIAQALRRPELAGRLEVHLAEGAVALALSAAADLEPQRSVDFAQRLAPEVRVGLGPVKLGAAGYLGSFSRGSGGTALAALGHMATAELEATSDLRITALWSHTRYTSAVRADARALGATSPLVRDAELALAARWQPFDDRALALSAELGKRWLRREGEPQSAELRARLQLQLDL